MKVSVLIPAYNEEENILKTLNSVHLALPGAEIIVVDDCSSDETAGLAEAANVRVLRHNTNRGKAEALATGLRHSSGEIVAMVDADMGSYAREIAKLVEAVKENQCDLAIALFARSGGGGVGLVRGLARWGIFIITGTWLDAPLSGQRAATRKLLEQCLPSRGGFGIETELSLRALRRGFKLLEVPTDFVHDGHGWTAKGIQHRGTQFFQVLLALCRGGILWRQR